MIRAADAEKVHQTRLEDSKAREPDKENVPHANEGGALDHLEATEEDIVVIVIIHNHDHVSNHAQGLQNVKHEAKHANVVTLVSLDDHAIVMFTRGIRGSVFVFL